MAKSEFDAQGFVDELKQIWAKVPVPPGALELGEPWDIDFANEERPIRYYTLGHGSLLRSRYEDGRLFLDRLDRTKGCWVEDTADLMLYWIGDDPDYPGPDMNLDGINEEQARELAAAAGVEL
jgi:hypothetical protein